MPKYSKIYVAGHKGLVGSALVRNLTKEGYENLLLKTRQELNLLDQKAVKAFFAEEKPEYVFLAAAKVGGIMANKTHMADFAYENLEIQNNVIWAAHQQGVKKLLFLGSSCIYPGECPQPMKEEYLLTGKPEPTNEGYALAKIAGLKLCRYIYDQYGQKFISVMPTNLYGPNDNFDLESSHVLPAMIRKFHEAKIRGNNKMVLWGTGSPRREFMHVDDLADACTFLMQNYDNPDFINIGTGEDTTIKELAITIKEIIGFEGNIIWDTEKPDGMMKKLLDVKKLHKFGWKHKINLREGIKNTYQWFLNYR
ncbi:MAG: GDP-L-fucose synthase [Candidatus Falkowbacteria bacterium]